MNPPARATAGMSSRESGAAEEAEGPRLGEGRWAGDGEGGAARDEAGGAAR